MSLAGVGNVVSLSHYKTAREGKMWSSEEWKILLAARHVLEGRYGDLMIEHDYEVEDGTKTVSFAQHDEEVGIMSVAYCAPHYVIWSGQGERLARAATLLEAIAAALYQTGDPVAQLEDAMARLRDKEAALRASQEGRGN